MRPVSGEPLRFIPMLTLTRAIGVGAAIVLSSFATGCGNSSSVPESVEAIAGLTERADPAGPADSARLTEPPAPEWVAVVDLDYENGSSYVLDWKDSSNYVLIRPRVGFGAWTIDRVTDGHEEQLASVVFFTTRKSPIIVRRTTKSVDVDLPSRVDLNFDLGPAPKAAKVGVVGFDQTPEVFQFTIGAL